jgi:glutathione S-transferase
MITITDFQRGARGLRVLWLCEEMGLPYTRNLENYPVSAHFRARNPIGSVPFLEDGAVAINESVAMLIYLAERYGPTPLLPGKDTPAYAQAIQMTVFGEATLGAYMNPLLMTKFGGAPDDQKANWTVKTLESELDQRAGAHVAHVLGDRPYLTGDAFTIADISVCCAYNLYQGALGKDVPPALGAWRARVQARPAYQRATAVAAQA